MEPDGDEGVWITGPWPYLYGEWATEFDSYIINTVTGRLEYDDGGWGMGFSGEIQGMLLFTRASTSGVIFIRYSEDGRPTDWDWSDPENPIAIPIDGDYIGVFFRNLTDTSGQFANPVDANFRTPAQQTLAAARLAFTVDTMGDYVSFWATYTRQ